MDALKNATFLSDTNDETSAEKHHFLNHIDYQNTTETPITVMGFQHRYLPLWGVQYHPESVSTEHGAKLISNFQAATYQWMLEKRRPLSTTPLSSHLLAYSAAVPKIAEKQTNPQKYQLYIKTSSHSWVDPDLLVEQLLTNDNVENMSWLDSSRSNSPYSRMSVLSTHPAMTMTYSTLHKQVRTTHRQNQATQISQLDPDTTFFDHVSDFLRQCGQVTPVALDKHARGVTDMEFQGGLVGYFGYEMKRESLPGYATPAAQACHCPSHDGDHCCVCVEEPDAAFQFVDRFFVFDLLKKQVYICCLVAQEPINQILSWIDAQEQTFIDTAKRIHKRQLANELINFTPASSARTSPTPFAANDGLFTPDVEHQHYLKTIEQCVDYIREGESYELCLTTRFRLQLPKQTMDLWRLYTHYLRRNNPAPFSALLMFPNLSLLSSSPERFLKVSADHVAEMKPIKGTIARALKCVCEENCCDFGAACEAKRLQEDEMRKQQLWQDVKERAENLMVL
jgi:para-aminobenzoate synthetase